MLYVIQNQWVSGICSSSGIQSNYKTFHNPDLFPFSYEGKEIHSLLMPLERGNLNPIFETLCFPEVRAIYEFYKPSDSEQSSSLNLLSYTHDDGQLSRNM
jgi:hypothetical protein